MSDNKKVADWNHIFLYAKGWYRREDTYEDLKQIISEYTANPVEYITKGDMIHILTDLLLKYSSAVEIKEVLIRAVWQTNVFGKKVADPVKALLQDILGKLSIVKCFENGETLLELGSPDPNILPLVDEEALARHTKLMESTQQMEARNEEVN